MFAQGGMAATSQPLSTQVALDILKLGGSAVDAAIAANAMEGVVEPMMNGIGAYLPRLTFFSGHPVPVVVIHESLAAQLKTNGGPAQHVVSCRLMSSHLLPAHLPQEGI